jgi:hypothetical protein
VANATGAVSPRREGESSQLPRGFAVRPVLDPELPELLEPPELRALPELFEPE